jgi:hypothetical protein
VELVLAFVSTGVAVVIVGDLGTRLFVRADEDGNRFIGAVQLHPFRLPVRSVDAAIRRYRASAATVVVEDRDLGWAPRPSSTSGVYAYDAAGIRRAAVDAAPPDTPAERDTRIALFGDSFTNGVDAAFADTWGAQLDASLRDHRQVEVLNFGVPAYAMDQAFLRWRMHGRRFRAHVVLFGLQVENVKRNVNIVRPLYNRFTDLPFSKPRFVLSGGTLRVVNAPALPASRLVATLSDFDRWPLTPLEGLYDPADYRVRPWHVSPFATIVVQRTAALLGLERNVNEVTDADVALSRAIVETFRREVEAAGSRFIVVHLPRLEDLLEHRRRGHLPTAAILGQLTSGLELVDTTEALLTEGDRASIEGLFNVSRHYSASGNRAVARAVARHLEAPRADSSAKAGQ